MAQSVQIVPKYLHSHVETYVNDYTYTNDEVSTPVDNNSKFVTIFRSPMGIDNVLIKKTDLSDFKKTYGNSDYTKYGQPLMMPIAMLASGNATVYSMRIMPEDAYAANGVLCLQYRTDATTGKFIIKYVANYISKDKFSGTSAYSDNKTFKKQLRLYAQTLATTVTDSNNKEWTQVPLVTFRMAGRGTYGNDYRWRIARNIDYENDYGIKMFTFEALSSTNGIQKVQTYVGSLITSPKYNSLTLINDIMDDQEVGNAVMDVQVFEENIETVYDAFKTFVEGLESDDQDEIPDIDCFDPFFGMVVNSQTANKNIQIVAETVGSDAISVDRPQGISLAGGDDGAFGVTEPVVDGETTLSAETVRYNAEVETYVKAFSGDLDRTILSTRRVPCDAILDANYPFEVKEALADLANLRESGLCYIDAGIETTLAEIDNIIEEYAIFNTRNISKEFQHYTVRDTVTRKKCEVTVTYFYAQSLAAHFRNNGSHIPFVKSNAILSGHVKNSMEPSIDDIDMDIKEKLYTNRINYFETIAENEYQRCSQSTAQMTTSDLIEENNMNTLFQFKSLLERDCWNNLYNFTSAEERARFTETEQAKFANWEGTKVDKVSVEFDVNDWEAERSIVHCYGALQFRNLNKRTLIEIDVNKRDYMG